MLIAKGQSRELPGCCAWRILVLAWAALYHPLAIKLISLPPLPVCLQVILTNQITTSLSNGLVIQADLVSPADDLSLSEGKRSLLSELKLYTDTNPHCYLQCSGDVWEQNYFSVSLKIHL